MYVLGAATRSCEFVLHLVGGGLGGDHGGVPLQEFGGGGIMFFLCVCVRISQGVLVYGSSPPSVRRRW